MPNDAIRIFASTQMLQHSQMVKQMDDSGAIRLLDNITC
jgi:hypothetical protein